MYRKTEEGLINVTYSWQKQSMKRRKMANPTYSRDEFRFWVLSQDNWKSLYDAWVESDYDKKLRPSVDRIDDYKGYAFGNIQLMTWAENLSKSHSDRRNGINRKGMRAIDQFTKDGKYINTYFNAKEAEKQTGAWAANVSNVCRGVGKTVKGFIWKYSD